MTNVDHRTRTYSWEDPMVGASAALEMSGMEYMQAMMDGKFPPPPIAITMNLRPAQISEGHVIFVAEPMEYHYNPIGVVHGGLAATLLDSALGCAVHTTMAKGMAYTTVELHVNYIRAITKETGILSCEATVLHSGRQVSTAEAKITDSRGKLYAHGTTTCMVFPVPTKSN